MKRKHSSLLKYTLSALLFSLLISFQALAADGLVYFSDPATEVGETVTVTMTVQCDNAVISDVDITLKYPAESLEFKKGTSTGGGAGSLRVHGKGTKDGDHKMNYDLTFKALMPGEYTVNIDYCEVLDSNNANISITHLGSSKITVTGNASAGSFGNNVLSSLDVSPGTLTPEFSPETTDYTVTVGLSVDQLTINALPSDTNSKVSVLGNENLKEGENDITIFVSSSDGQQQKEYHINVLKTEGGEEIIPATTETPTVETTNGVQLSCKGKTITIIDVGDGIVPPEGFRESQIRIDGQPVKGWICGDDTQPEYFLVYGMNDQGELNFYRYDRIEKTIQRYFNDTVITDPKDTEEYILLESSLKASEAKLSSGKLVLSIISIIALLMLGILIYLGIRLSTVNRELESIQNDRYSGSENRKLDPDKSSRTVSRSSFRDYYDEEKNMDEEDDMEKEDEDATKVMPTSTRRRVSRKASAFADETTVIRRTSRRNRNHGSEFEDI